MANKHEVLVFRPSLAEFQDFSKYVLSIQPHVEAGICKVIPPPGWKPAIDNDHMNRITIKSPARQHVLGAKGIYKIVNITERDQSVEEFRAAVERIRPKVDTDDPVEIARQFWKNVMFKPPLYGGDMSGTLMGPEVKAWNLNRLGTLLDLPFVPQIPGMNTPYLYFGMWKALFSLHTEDFDLFSINFVHYGASKYWYSVPPRYADSVTKLAQDCFREDYSECSQFLRHKTFLLSPSVLAAHNIPCYHTQQHEGEFVLTFPQAYHFGFNAGFNCAESTNFALETWLPYGLKAEFCKCVEYSIRLNMKLFTIGPGLCYKDGKPYRPFRIVQEERRGKRLYYLVEWETINERSWERATAYQNVPRWKPMVEKWQAECAAAKSLLAPPPEDKNNDNVFLKVSPLHDSSSCALPHDNAFLKVSPQHDCAFNASFSPQHDSALPDSPTSDGKAFSFEDHQSCSVVPHESSQQDSCALLDIPPQLNGPALSIDAATSLASVSPQPGRVSPQVASQPDCSPLLPTDSVFQHNSASPSSGSSTSSSNAHDCALPDYSTCYQSSCASPSVFEKRSPQHDCVLPQTKDVLLTVSSPALPNENAFPPQQALPNGGVVLKASSPPCDPCKLRSLDSIETSLLPQHATSSSSSDRLSLSSECALPASSSSPSCDSFEDDACSLLVPPSLDDRNPFSKAGQMADPASSLATPPLSSCSSSSSSSPCAPCYYSNDLLPLSHSCANALSVKNGDQPSPTVLSPIQSSPDDSREKISPSLPLHDNTNSPCPCTQQSNNTNHNNSSGNSLHPSSPASSVASSPFDAATQAMEEEEEEEAASTPRSTSSSVSSSFGECSPISSALSSPATPLLPNNDSPKGGKGDILPIPSEGNRPPTSILAPNGAGGRKAIRARKEFGYVPIVNVEFRLHNTILNVFSIRRPKKPRRDV